MFYSFFLFGVSVLKNRDQKSSGLFKRFNWNAYFQKFNLTNHEQDVLPGINEVNREIRLSSTMDKFVPLCICL